MHPHIIDWFRNSEIHLDQKLAEARWNAAKKYSEKLNRAQCVALVRLFAFAKIDPVSSKQVTDAFLAIDKEFPVANNAETLRLMAGLVIVYSCSARLWQADAMCLGLRAARFPGQRGNPAHSEIAAIAETYLCEEANLLRPSDFDAEVQSGEKALIAKSKAIQDATAAGDAAKIQAAQLDYQKTLASIIQQGDVAASGQIRRLAEESALLWWVFNEHSSALNCSLSSLPVARYALVAAAEAAERSKIIPPPPSMNALISRALRACQGSITEKLPLANYLSEVDVNWRKGILQTLNYTDCGDILPITTALSKCQECGDVEYAIKILPNLCSGIAADMKGLPTEVCQQFFTELSFLNALGED